MFKMPKLPASSIDERIRDALKFNKSRAVLKYLQMGGAAKPPPLHPDYVCWWNSCEDLADWTFAGGASGSINTSVFQENIGSLQIVTAANTAGSHATTPVTYCDIYFGFWWRIQTSISKFEQFWLFGTPTTYYCAIYPHGATGRFYYLVLDPNTYPSGIGYEDPTLVVTQGVWYWIEIYRPSVGLYNFRVNGSPRCNFSTGGNMGNFQSFRAGSMNGAGVPSMTHLVDYLRFADRYEYPPA